MFFGVVRGGARRWLAFPGLQPPAVRVRAHRPWRSSWRCSSPTGDGARERCRNWRSGRLSVGVPVPADRPAARPRHRDVAGARVSRRRPTWPASGCSGSGRRDRAGAALAGDLAVRTPGLSKGPHRDLRRPVQGSHGATAISSCRPRSPSDPADSTGRASCRGPRGRTGSCRSRTTTSCSPSWPKSTAFSGVLVAMALYLFVIVRSLDAAKLARDRIGSLLVVAIVSGFRVPSVVQHHHVGRVGAGQRVCRCR